nr:hypothetical protein [Tanacetum cinerariifolium]
MAGSDSSSGISRHALDELVDLSGETKVPKFMSFVFSQQIAKEKAFANMIHDQADHVRSCLDAEGTDFDGLYQLTEVANSSRLQDHINVWFVHACTEEEAFAGFLCDRCIGLRMSLNTNQRDFAKRKVLEQLLARTHVGICLKDSYVADMEEISRVS